MSIPPEPAGEFIEIPAGAVDWRFERAFLQSNWTCIWGRGCLGILDEPAPELQQGCCSIGAELDDAEDAMTVSAYAATLGPAVWQFHDAVDDHGVFSDADAHEHEARRRRLHLPQPSWFRGWARVRAAPRGIGCR